MTISNHNHSNREPRQNIRRVYKSYTTRTCDVCGHDIISPEDQIWACATCEIQAKINAGLDEAVKVQKTYDEQLAASKIAPPHVLDDMPRSKIGADILADHADWLDLQARQNNAIYRGVSSAKWFDGIEPIEF